MGALLQDAICPISRMTYKDQQFHMVLNRFCWEIPNASDNDHPELYYRVHTQVTLDHVESVQYKGFSLTESLRSLNFLAFCGSSNTVICVFSQDCAMRFQMKSLQCWVCDLDEPWVTPNIPTHESGSSAQSASEG